MVSLVLLASEGGWTERREGGQTQVGCLITSQTPDHRSSVRNGQGPQEGSEGPDEGVLETFVGQNQQGLVTGLTQELGSR